jgi:hypothetical protein
MTYNLFLDDIRDPPEKMENVKIARNVTEAKALIREFGVPDHISFDHDLGELETGQQFLWYLIQEHLNCDLNLSTIKRITIHSANPVGAGNIQGLWDAFAEFINSAVRANAPVKEPNMHLPSAGTGIWC